MTVYLVGAGPGDPGLLTRRGAELLSEADVVLYDRLVHHSLLALAPVSADLIDVGKRPDTSAGGADRQDEINRLLVLHGRRHGVVVRLKGGDPFLFGRGGEEAGVLTAAGIPWVVVPGVTSAFAVPAAAGIPVTHRGMSSSVTVVTGRVGDPATDGGVDWATLASLPGTLVILMGMTTRAEVAAALMQAGKPPDTPTAVIARGTTASQEVVRTTLDKLADVPLGSPSVIVIGPVAAMGASWSVATPGPLSGRSVIVTRSGPQARGLIQALEAAGAGVVDLPLTEQVDPADGGAGLNAAAADIGHYVWVVFTSVNAVERLMRVLRDARQLGGVKVAAVGSATARALRAAGIQADLVPTVPRAEGLVDVFPERDPSNGDRVLFPSADIASSTIEGGLARKGWVVTRVHAYRTVALPPPAPGVLARAAAADALTVTAPSTLDAFVALHGADGRPLSVPPMVVCLGATTAAHARALGLPNVLEAADPSNEGLVATLVAQLSASGPHPVGS